MVLSPIERPRILGDITGSVTNTPPPREDSSPISTPPPLSIFTVEGSSITGTASVQRFSLRSRSARLRAPRAVSNVRCKLHLPRYLNSDVTEYIRICDCSDDPCLGTRRRRLCKQATDEHDEFRMLELLNSRFISDCRSGGELIATKACLNEMDTFFILEPVSNAVMGYAAVNPEFDHGVEPGSGGFCIEDSFGVIAAVTAGKLPLLSQLYVEPQARKKGLATAALRVLLASHSAAVVESPSLAAARAMLRLGFKPVGAHWLEGCPRVLYVRLEALASGLGADENA